MLARRILKLLRAGLGCHASVDIRAEDILPRRGGAEDVRQRLGGAEDVGQRWGGGAFVHGTGAAFGGRNGYGDGACSADERMSTRAGTAGGRSGSVGHGCRRAGGANGR
jgi:hypothetical protein